MNKLIEDFYRENYSLLVNRLVRRAGTREDAEDVVQEAFCRAIKYQNSFDPNRQDMGAWFNTILNNTLVAHKRVERHQGMSIEYEEDKHAETYEMSQTDDDMVNRIKSEIGKQPAEVRDVLHLHFLKEFRVSEINHILDIPIRTIRHYIYRFKGQMIGEFGDEN